MSSTEALFQLFSGLTDEEKRLFLVRAMAPTREQQDIASPIDRDTFLQSVQFRDGVRCPHCQGEKVVRNGHRRAYNAQQYLCRDCGKSFTAATNSLLFGSVKGLEVWQKYVQCMMDGMSIRKSAQACDIAVNTAFVWRHKILDALQAMASSVTLNGVIEADETFFGVSYKGNHKKSKTFSMPRPAHHRGTPATKRGLSKEKVCVPCAVNRDGKSIAKLSNLGKVGVIDLCNVLGGRIEEESVLVTDKEFSYKTFSARHGLNLVQIKSGKHRDGMFHIQHINNYHSRLKRFIDSFLGVSTKYLNNYLVWHNFTNYAKETRREKEAICLKFVTAVNGVTSFRNISRRNPVPLLR